MPYVDHRTAVLIQLHDRCRNRNALPEAGGVLDQSERIMEDFDVIDQTIKQHQRRLQEQKESEWRALNRK